jgi:hypothetical protein
VKATSAEQVALRVEISTLAAVAVAQVKLKVPTGTHYVNDWGV